MILVVKYLPVSQRTFFIFIPRPKGEKKLLITFEQKQKILSNVFFSLVLHLLLLFPLKTIYLYLPTFLQLGTCFNGGILLINMRMVLLWYFWNCIDYLQYTSWFNEYPLPRKALIITEITTGNDKGAKNLNIYIALDKSKNIWDRNIFGIKWIVSVADVTWHNTQAWLSHH